MKKEKKKGGGGGGAFNAVKIEANKFGILYLVEMKKIIIYDNYSFFAVIECLHR